MPADVENPEDPSAGLDENAVSPAAADVAGEEATALLEPRIADPRTTSSNSPPLSTRTQHPDNHIITVNNLDEYQGESLHDKVDDFSNKHAVVMFSKARNSQFSMEAKDLLGTQIGVDVYSIDLDVHPQGGEIFQYVCKKNNNNRSTLPLIYINGKFVGGCEDIKALHATGQLENVYLKGLIIPSSSAAASNPRQRQPLYTGNPLVPADTDRSRSRAVNPPFWFPNTVNSYVMRGVGFQVFVLSGLSVAFHFKPWGRYLAVALLVDSGLRFVAGPSISLLGMIATLATCKYTPDFRPGPPHQFASFSGAFISTMAVIFSFVDFKGHDILGAIWMAILAIIAGIEAFLDYSLGCVVFEYGIQYGLIPEGVNRIHSATREETIDTWKYNYQDSNAPVPVRVNTNPKSDISLKYKRKTDEWTKDDFDPIRHMQVLHFAMPLAISGLAVAFKIASDWSDPYGQATIRQPRSIIAADAWFQVISFIGAFVFIFFCLIYSTRMYMFPKKCWKDWDCPLRSSGFGMIPTIVMFYAFLIYDEISKREPGGDEENSQTFARVLWWIGAVSHTMLTVAKFGEWIGRRMELEHVHPHWMIFPVGLAVAAFVAPVVGVFADNNERAGGNAVLARFFYSFAWLVWITLFVVTFFKVVTQHNSDDRLRHGVFFWLATPNALGLADYAICFSSNVLDRNTCEAAFAEKYFIGIFLFMSLVWATLKFNFFGRASFDMGYWIECFALATLAASASLFYALNGWQISQTLQSIGLVLASVATAVCFFHTATACVLQHGVFTPDVKWNPLSFIKLTHEAFRCNIEALQEHVDKVDVEDESAEAKENLGLFAAHLTRFCIVHEEHAKHEDLVVFKTFNDYFPKHARRYYEDHSQDTIMIRKWRKLVNVIVDTKLAIEHRKSALDELRSALPDFFTRFEKHINDEDENLEPIGRKYLPLEITKQLSRDVWKITNKWEIIIPFVIMNLPRHGSRVRYLKVLCWGIPERAQQIGAILYQHVDAVMWEQLRFEVPEIIPRGASGWKRYY